MNGYAVIVENDSSDARDETGKRYHYPGRYSGILEKGCQVIYYKRKMKDKAFANERLSPDPHYFGMALVGDSSIDPYSKKRVSYCDILDYQQFDLPVFNKVEGQYLEEIPESKKTVYWRDVVRPISKDVYDRILQQIPASARKLILPSDTDELESYTTAEGNKKYRYSSYYERHPVYREKALEVHGLSCMVCSFNFESTFGAAGRGYIQVHHNKPLNESGPTAIDVVADMSVLCPNCHSMIHRCKERTLTVNELKSLLRSD